MGAISGWVYIALGILMGGTSLWTGSISEESNLAIFKYVAMFFLFIGAFKIIKHFILGKKLPPNKIEKKQAIEQRKKLEAQKNKIVKQYEQQRQQEDTKRRQDEQARIAAQQPESIKQHHGLKICPRCGLKNAHYDTHCEKCGMQL